MDIPNINDLLDEREKTHGPYADKCAVIQALKYVMEERDGWYNLCDVQKESLHMIVHKIGRILTGDADCADHWDDIAGYAKLVTRELERDAASQNGGGDPVEAPAKITIRSVYRGGEQIYHDEETR